MKPLPITLNFPFVLNWLSTTFIKIFLIQMCPVWLRPPPPLISTSSPCPYLTLSPFSCLSLLRTDWIKGVAVWWWCKVLQSGAWRWWSFNLVSARQWSMWWQREMSQRSQIRVEWFVVMVCGDFLWINALWQFVMICGLDDLFEKIYL